MQIFYAKTCRPAHQRHYADDSIAGLENPLGFRLAALNLGAIQGSFTLRLEGRPAWLRG